MNTLLPSKGYKIFAGRLSITSIVDDAGRSSIFITDLQKLRNERDF